MRQRRVTQGGVGRSSAHTPRARWRPPRPTASPLGALWLTAAVLVTAALVGGCSSEDDPSGGADSEPTAPTSEATAPTSEARSAVELALVDIGVDLDAPMDVHPLGSSLLVAERRGRVRELVADGGGGYTSGGTVVDLRDEVGNTDAEKGLLGVTTDASGEHMYVNYTRDEDGATVVAEFPLRGEPGESTVGEPRTLLVIDQPFPNHNGGDLTRGPDDMLWIGTGDGGASGDPDGRAQRLDTLLGKILRLDPSMSGDGSDLAPEDNPYAGGRGPDGADPLIWSRGLRNPWRISFDAATGDLWVADVGQNRIEEVSVLRAADGLGRGADLGWDRLEGDEPFEDPGPTDGWPDDGAPVIDPVHTYGHEPGCSITGGYVYRGSALPELAGAYLFSDYCDGTLRALLPDGNGVDLGASGEGVVSIDPDGSGEPLVLDATGLRRLTPAPGDT